MSCWLLSFLLNILVEPSLDLVSKHRQIALLLCTGWMLDAFQPEHCCVGPDFG